MNWFYNLSTRNKLTLSFGVILILLLGTMYIIYHDIENIKHLQQKTFTEEFDIIHDLSELRIDLTYQQNNMIEFLVTDSVQKRNHLKLQIENRSQRLNANLQRIQTAFQNNPQTLLKLEELRDLLTRYRAMWQNQIDAAQYGRNSQALSAALGGQSQLFNRLVSTALDIEILAKANVRSNVLISNNKFTEILNLVILLTIIALSLVVFLTIFLSKILAEPLKLISTAAAQIAGGDLNVSLPEHNRKDEVGNLNKEFKRMTGTLQQMAAYADKIAGGDLSVKIIPQSEKDVLGNSFNLMIQNLRSITKEVFDAVNILNISAGQILSASSNLASSATETASAVSETTSTVEEVKHTSQLSKQKAKYVSDAAQKSVQISQSGIQSVVETTNGMNNINSQMNIIADTIIKLSEQSQAISDILTTVNDLTEQSNLLAVNASIEAAKAGEHGKGFSVVAHEVRSLAEQSKQSTSQIKLILNDIQKAMNAAVLATEHGNKAVDKGVKQSSESGNSIRTLADSISESAQAAAQILASVQEQMVGLEQISLAMSNIKEVINQNVASTKQVETSANSLNDLGKNLQKLIKQYKL